MIVPELGILGFSVEEKVLVEIKKDMPDTIINTGIIKTVLAGYYTALYNGYKPVNYAGVTPDADTKKTNDFIAQNTGQTALTVGLVMRSLFRLAMSGKIEPKELDPKTAKEQKEAIAAVTGKSEFDLFAAGKSVTGTINKTLIVAAILGIAYIVMVGDKNRMFEKRG